MYEDEELMNVVNDVDNIIKEEEPCLIEVLTTPLPSPQLQLATSSSNLIEDFNTFNSEVQLKPIKVRTRKLRRTTLNLDNNYECDRCGKRYKRKPTLNRHLRLECGITPKFACCYCELRFKRKEYLVAHLKLRHNHY